MNRLRLTPGCRLVRWSSSKTYDSTTRRPSTRTASNPYLANHRDKPHKGPRADSRFYRQAEDYTEIGSSDDYNGLFRESTSVQKVRIREWQRQFETIAVKESQLRH